MSLKVGFLVSLVLAAISTVYGAGPLGPLDSPALINPYKPGGEIGNKNCRGFQTEVYISTYISGYQLNEQMYPLAKSIGAVFYIGPQLTLTEPVDKYANKACSVNVKSSVPTLIPPLNTAGIYLGGGFLGFVNDVVYKVSRPVEGSKSQYFSNGCAVTLKSAYEVNPELGNGGYFALQPNEKCSEWKDLKIAYTAPWCQSSTDYANFPDGCGYNYVYGLREPSSTMLVGINYFIYFEGVSAAAAAASTNISYAFGPVAAPLPSNPDEAESSQSPQSGASTSSGIKAPLPVVFFFALPFLLLNSGMGKRTTVVCLFFCLVLSVRAHKSCN